MPRNSYECQAGPCTNCQRGNKICTFDWLRSAGSDVQEGKRRRLEESPETRSAGKISSSAEQKGHIGSHAYLDSNYSTEFLGYLSPVNLSPELQKTLDAQSRHDDQSRKKAIHPPRHNFQPKPFRNVDSLDNRKYYSDQSLSMDFAISGDAEYGSQPSKSEDSNISDSRGSSNAGRGRTSQPQFRNRTSLEPSLLLSHWSLSEATSQHFITGGLLRIYHDSMENALSCWLTEHNCPYTSITHRMKPITALKSENPSTSEWGSIWSNRIYSRVCHLDQAYSSIRDRPLSWNEERLISQALNLAVMSFAAQWAQAGDRSANVSMYEEGYQSPGFGDSSNAFPLADEFGREMQKNLWHQASRVLHEAAGIESFRVVFALIIFSLTQRPLDIESPSLSTRTSRLPQFIDLQQITEADGPPLFLETALRQVFSYRRKLEDVELRKAEAARSDGFSRYQNQLQLADHETFNLLFWLGVMFDTLSAAMTFRPLVVEDEDTNLIPQSGDEWPQISPEISLMNTHSGRSRDFGDAEHLHLTNELWGDRFLSVKTDTAEPTRWPCSYEQAASILSDAAPVKVLLFRRVTRLQTLLSRKSCAAKIESAINDAFHVYNYWNRVYGPFMLDCVAYHDKLPPRIQSWYILLAGHWHLANFLLADIVESIDKTNLSLAVESKERQRSNLVSKVRHENAKAVSELCRSSLHGSHGRSFTKAREFHFAVNKGALLTEPWTVVLIRSFSRAGFVLANASAEESRYMIEQESRYECENCIEALWLLGKKSDMAFMAARFLANMLKKSQPNTTTSVKTDGIQSATSTARGDEDKFGTESSFSVLDKERSLETAFMELPDSELFGFDSLGSESITDFQSYSMLEDIVIDDDGSDNSQWDSERYADRPFENANPLLFVDGA